MTCFVSVAAPLNLIKDLHTLVLYTLNIMLLIATSGYALKYSARSAAEVTDIQTRYLFKKNRSVIAEAWGLHCTLIGRLHKRCINSLPGP